MTNDLISRSALLERIDMPEDYFAKVGKIYEIIKEAPAVDAAPVVHGRWKTEVTSPICSVCNYVARYW